MVAKGPLCRPQGGPIVGEWISTARLLRPNPLSAGKSAGSSSRRRLTWKQKSPFPGLFLVGVPGIEPGTSRV